MANWSYTSVSFTGEPEAIDKAHTYISMFIKDNWLDPSSLAKDDSVEQRVEFSTMQIDTFFKDKGYIRIVGQG